jgi:hypothetical protein
MSFWPEGAVTRDVVDDALSSSCDWHVEYCAGAQVPSASGYGRQLPDGVLERVPSRAKRRKIERGLERDKTWVFAFLLEENGKRRLHLHEGPM